MRQLKSLVLPFSAIVILPALILLLARSTPFGLNIEMPAVRVPVGAVICLLGLALMAVTIRMLIIIGRGTLAPWDPTSKLVTDGIYGRMRNPMISGVLAALLGESIVFGSLGVLLWAAVFFITNTLYFHFSEEKGLEERFGEEYLEYKRHVPMWLPRPKRWEKPREAA